MSLEWSSNSVHKLISQFHFLKYLKHQLPLNLIKSLFCFKRESNNQLSCSHSQVSVLNQHKKHQEPKGGLCFFFLNKKWFDAASGWWQPSRPRKVWVDSSKMQRPKNRGTFLHPVFLRPQVPNCLCPSTSFLLPSPSTAFHISHPCLDQGFSALSPS